MVDSNTETMAVRPNSSDQTQTANKQALSQEAFQQLYQDAHKKSDQKSIVADGQQSLGDFKNVVDKSGVEDLKNVLTLRSDTALKELPLGVVSQDGSIHFDKQDGGAESGHHHEVHAGVIKDSSGHVTEVDYANGQSRKFGYDDKGNLNQITDVDGSVAKLDPKTGTWVSANNSAGAGGDSQGESKPPPKQGEGGSLGGLLGGMLGNKKVDFVNPKVSDDGTFTYSTSDGKDKTFNPDGSSVAVNSKDNSTVKTDTNGNVTEVDYGNGQSRQFQYTKDGNGDSHLTSFTDPNGKSYNLKDGKWLNADGSDSAMTQVAVDADGNFKETSKEGQTTTINTDFSKSVENPNHSVLTEDANGKVSKITYENGKTVSFGYADCSNDPNSITDQDGKTITKNADGKWVDASGNDTGIKNVSLQSDGSYTYVDKDNHLVMNDTDGKPKTTTETIDQIQQAAKDIHDAENRKFLWFINNPDGGKVDDTIKNMSPTDRLVLEQQYQQMYGKKLTDDISSTLNKGDAATANKLLDIANVQEDAAKYIPENERQAFMDNMNTFLDRAKQKGMSDEEIASTFAATQRLLEAQDGKVSEKLREQLAQQIMAEAAHPDHTDQGGHLTCNVTDIETRTWTNNPSVMANMVADVALNGSYTASDGKKITIPPQNLVPDGEAVDNPPRDGARSFASQIIQATMLNDVGQRETPPKYFAQLAPTEAASSGEFWTDANGTPLIIPDGDKKGQPMAFGGIGYDDIAKEAKRLTGDDKTTFLHGDGDDYLVGFNSEKELQDKLLQAKKDGKLPIIIDVTADDPLFGGKYPAGDTSVDKDGKPNRHGGDHVVCIDDYNPDTGMVRIDNSWGSGSDKWVPLHDLYNATV